MPRLVAPVVDSGRLASVDQPVLMGGGAALRPWRDADADAVVDAFRDEQIERWHIRRLDRAEAVSWIGDWRRRWAAETDASWSIVEPGGDEATGYVAIRGISLDGGYGQISYWVRPAFRRRGLATLAVKIAAAWAFDDVGLHRIEIRHSVENAESCGVAVRAGSRTRERPRLRCSMPTDGTTCTSMFGSPRVMPLRNGSVGPRRGRPEVRP